MVTKLRSKIFQRPKGFARRSNIGNVNSRGKENDQGPTDHLAHTAWNAKRNKLLHRLPLHHLPPTVTVTIIIIIIIIRMTSTTSAGLFQRYDRQWRHPVTVTVRSVGSRVGMTLKGINGSGVFKRGFRGLIGKIGRSSGGLWQGGWVWWLGGVVTARIAQAGHPSLQ